MKTYNVNFERKGEIISTFTIHADNYKCAVKGAQFNKRRTGHKGKVIVKLIKTEKIAPYSFLYKK